ncbi:hypothetical protein GOP47_0027472 [Adiantum capillus-veneris]|nr:hypothetical protein GOP47_0027472 [Adiantum capillus-veneris]
MASCCRQEKSAHLAQTNQPAEELVNLNVPQAPSDEGRPWEDNTSTPLQAENSAAFFLWPPAYRLQGSAIERTNYFCGLQKDISSDVSERAPSGPQATTLLDLMTIRSYHSEQLRRVSVGTAIGFRIKQGVLTNIPAIIVFVSRKVHKAWLQKGQRLPVHLEGPGCIWCDVDVVEFAYHCTTGNTSKEQVYTELVEGLRGNDPCIGPGSQVASQETYGTLGAIVQSKNGACQVGFLTNRHVAVDMDYPNQKMFHPLPPNCGPGIYLGAVERATSYISDERWYHFFASVNPETFVRADGAFIPFCDGFDMSKVTTIVKGVGAMGEAKPIELLAQIDSIVGRQVMKVGRSTGLTQGRIMAYAMEYNDARGICYFTDLLVIGENKQTFDLEGDSGSIILMTDGTKPPRPVGMIWGGNANRGRLKMQSGHGLENWTSAVDLGRLLDRLQLDLITSNAALEAAILKQRWVTMEGLNAGDCLSRSLSFYQPIEVYHHAPVFKTQKMKQRKRTHEGDLGNLEELGRLETEQGWTFVNASDSTSEAIDFLGEGSFEHEASKRNSGHDLNKHMPALKNAGKEDNACALHLYSADTKQRWL